MRASFFSLDFIINLLPLYFHRMNKTKTIPIKSISRMINNPTDIAFIIYVFNSAKLIYNV